MGDLVVTGQTIAVVSPRLFRTKNAMWTNVARDTTRKNYSFRNYYQPYKNVERSCINYQVLTIFLCPLCVNKSFCCLAVKNFRDILFRKLSIFLLIQNFRRLILRSNTKIKISNLLRPKTIKQF